MGKRNKIWVGPADGANQKPLIVEGLVVDDFSAGELLVQTSSGLATASAAATIKAQEVLLAREIGAHLGGDIDTKATVGDTGQAIALRSGEFAYVRMAATQNITSKGTALTSNGDGTFKISTVATDFTMLRAQEIINVVSAGTLVLVSAL